MINIYIPSLIIGIVLGAILCNWIGLVLKERKSKGETKDVILERV